MIFSKGNRAPSKEQIKHAWATADGTFCTSASIHFEEVGLPTFDDMVPACAITLLKLKNVEPHDDPWVGDGSGGPVVRRSIFWLLGFRSPHRHIDIFTGSTWTRMRVGDFIVFDDSQVHAVIADHLWVGATWQLKTTDWKPE